MSRLPLMPALLAALFAAVLAAAPLHGEAQDAASDPAAVAPASAPSSDALAAPQEAPDAAPVSGEDSETLPPKPRNGWVARFFWSPEYCSRHRGSREVQCGLPRQGFVLRDLVRIIDGKEVDECQGAPLQMSPQMLDQMARFTKNRVETRASWRLYGRCSGLSEADYASWTEFVDRRMSWPEEYMPGGKDIDTSAAEVAARIIEDNPGLDGEIMQLQCNRAWLSSVEICLDGAFNYDKTACPVASSCGTAVRIRGRR